MEDTASKGNHQRPDWKKEETSNYFSGDNFYILHNFNDDLRDGIVIPMTNAIARLAKQTKPIMTIWINSHGGNAELCMHIVALMELAKSKGIIVRTVVTDVAYSAGSIAAVAGTPGERYIARSAEHLAHYGTQYGWSETTPLQIDRNTDKKRRHFQKLLKHYEKYCKIPKLADALKDDSFFITAPQAIRWKMADKYLERLT